MFVATLAGMRDDYVLGVKPTIDEAKTLCVQAHNRYVEKFKKARGKKREYFALIEALGPAFDASDLEPGGTYFHTAVQETDANGLPVKGSYTIVTENGAKAA